jgi:hypothetical protein
MDHTKNTPTASSIAVRVNVAPMTIVQKAITPLELLVVAQQRTEEMVDQA